MYRVQYNTQNGFSSILQCTGTIYKGLLFIKHRLAYFTACTGTINKISYVYTDILLHNLYVLFYVMYAIKEIDEIVYLQREADPFPEPLNS